MVLAFAIAGCATLEQGCLGLGFGPNACAEPATPLPGAWVLDFGGASDVCGLQAPERGWGLTLDNADAFTLVPADGGGAACSLADEVFECDAATTADGLTIGLSGAFSSRSTGDATATVTLDTCSSTLDVALLAGWLTPETSTGAAGACPQRYSEAYGFDAADATYVPFTIENRSDVSLGVFTIADEGGAISATAVAPLETASASQALGGWVALAADWDEETCVYFFQVTVADQAEVYWPE